MAKKVSAEKFAAVLRAKADGLRPAAINGIRKAGLRLVVLVEHAIRNTSPFPLVDRGRLVSDTQVTMIPDGCIVRNNAPYASSQEFGTRPFAPPVQVLIEWATRKGFLDPVGVAWAVRANFIKRGIKPKRFFARALAEWKASKVLSAEVHKALAAKNDPTP